MAIIIAADTLIENRYRLLDRIGSGTSGQVWRAQEEVLGEVVGELAVKLIEIAGQEQKALLIREIQALAQLSHPNILIYRSSGVHQDGSPLGICYIATELAERSLEEERKRKGVLGEETARRLGLETAAALAYIHGRGAIHRDVKPANVLRVNGTWKLGDFGLARAVEGSLVAATLGAGGMWKGTLGYQSPEAVRGQTGSVVDIYALGVTLLECLTGQLAHEGSSAGEFIMNLATRPPFIPETMAEPWKTLIPRCLDRDPTRRIKAAEIAGMLEGRAAPGAARSGASEIQSPPLPPGMLPEPVGLGGTARCRNPKDGAVLIYIPPGEFLMGSSDQDRSTSPNEKPQHRVFLDGYWIYETPVTVAQYQKFCTATRAPMPGAPGWGWKGDHPIVNVNWDGAKAYCTWAGVFLPREAEWEKAARGTDGRSYPWGNEWDASKCVCSVRPANANSTAPVGSFPSGASTYGVLDMAGNVWEWCEDWYDANYYANDPQRNPTGPASGRSRVLRGGSWYLSFTSIFRCAFRFNYIPSAHFILFYGFRGVLRAGSS